MLKINRINKDDTQSGFNMFRCVLQERQQVLVMIFPEHKSLNLLNSFILYLFNGDQANRNKYIDIVKYFYTYGLKFEFEDMIYDCSLVWDILESFDEENNIIKYTLITRQGNIGQWISEQPSETFH